MGLEAAVPEPKGEALPHGRIVRPANEVVLCIIHQGEAPIQRPQGVRRLEPGPDGGEGVPLPLEPSLDPLLQGVPAGIQPLLLLHHALFRQQSAPLPDEQLHPIPHRRLREALDRYPNLSEVRWVQEEPANQGAWSFLALELPERIDDFPRLKRVSRRPMAATSTGLSKVHAVEQKALVDEAFA